MTTAPLPLSASRRTARLTAVLLVAGVATLTSAIPLAAQDHPHADTSPSAPDPNDPASRVSRSTEPDPAADAAVERARAEWVNAFLADVPNPLGADDTPRVTNTLRAHVGRLDSWLAIEVEDFTRRRKVRVGLHELLVDGLEAATGTGTENRARRILEDAEKAHMEKRREYLRGRIICWCPDEGWTKTLSGCPDGCANDQRTLVDRWLAAGLSDQEIFDRMVAHERGGPRVISVPKDGRDSRFFILPFLFAGVGIIGFAAMLRRLLSRGRAQAATLAPSVPPPPAEDAVWDAQIEAELKEMDD